MFSFNLHYTYFRPYFILHGTRVLYILEIEDYHFREKRSWQVASMAQIKVQYYQYWKYASVRPHLLHGHLGAGNPFYMYACSQQGITHALLEIKIQVKTMLWTPMQQVKGIG